MQHLWSIKMWNHQLAYLVGHEKMLIICYSYWLKNTYCASKLLTCGHIISQMILTMSKPKELHHFIQGNHVFHLVACSCHFQESRGVRKKACECDTHINSSGNTRQIFISSGVFFTMKRTNPIITCNLHVLINFPRGSPCGTNNILCV